MQDSSEDEIDGESDVPTLLTPVRLHPACKSEYRNAVLHWASVTPEVQVLPVHIAEAASGWLKQQGRIPADALDDIGEQCPHVWELMMADAETCSPKAGHFWQLSARLQDLLTRMVQMVQHTVSCEVAVTTPLMPSRDHMTEYILPTGCARTTPTSFELFLWVRSACPVYGRTLSAGLASACGVRTVKACMPLPCIQPHSDRWPRVSMRSSGRGCP
jgi:hypothetical protein